MGVAGEDFDDLVRRYRRELHVYCYRMLGSFDEAEDHVQEVLLRAWRARDDFQGRSSPRTWLYRVATNACLDTLRRDARVPFVLTVLRFEHGRLTDMAAFEQPSMFGAFGLPASL